MFCECGCGTAVTGRYVLGHNLRGMRGTAGMQHSLETRQKMSEQRKGDRHWNWQGGITPVRDAIRRTFEYREWRTAVFERDDYTCQECGVRGVYLHAHHIKSFAAHPDLRTVVENGITLCEGCHTKPGRPKTVA